MRIGFDARCVYRGMGGIGRYASSLLGELSMFDDRHDYVCYFTPLDLPDRLRLPERARRRIVEAGMIDERFDQLILPGLLEEDRIDLYFNPTFASPLVKGPRIRTAATVHDVVFRRHPELVPEKLKTYLDRAAERACRNADQVITGSNFSKREILSLYTTPEKEIAVIPHGVHPPGRDAGSSSQFAGRFGLLPNRYVLYVGSIEPKKNIRMLLEAFAQVLRKLDRPFSLALAGAHNAVEFPLQSTIEQLGLAKHVRLLGYVSDDDLEDLYRFASVFVYPSLYEGFGLPPLEAMIRGIPTIVADTSSLAEVVGDGAVLVPPAPAALFAEAMAALLMNESQREVVRERGRRRAAQFTWKSSAERHVAVFEQILERHL